MTTYVDGGDGMPQCTDCANGECITAGQFCEDPFCYCGCGLGAQRLDDRPADRLAMVANELERERNGNLRDLTAERFGRGRAA